MWEGAKVAAVLFLLAACAADEEQRRAQREEFAKAAAEAEAQIAQQDDARCKSYGRPGSAAYIDCRTSLKNDRADMKKCTGRLRCARFSLNFLQPRRAAGAPSKPPKPPPPRPPKPPPP